MGTDIKRGTYILGGDRHKCRDRHDRWGQTNTKHHGFRIQKKIQEPGGLVKRDFRSHSGFSEHSLDSESKFEPSVAIDIIGGDRHKSWGQTL